MPAARNDKLKFVGHLPKRNRGRIALSPSQPGLNPRSSKDDRSQDVLCARQYRYLRLRILYAYSAEPPSPASAPIAAPFLPPINPPIAAPPAVPAATVTLSRWRSQKLRSRY